jgi:predicted ATP-grasp superfamily ATP-dependent carboligase
LIPEQIPPNPLEAKLDWPAAVIAGAFQTGVLGVRCLQRRGVRAICLDCNPDQPGFRSVYGPARLCPNPDTDPDAWVRFMVALADEIGGRPALISSADQFVSAIAAHREALAPHYRLSPGASLQGLLADKQSQYALAAEHGMPMPRSLAVTSREEVVSFADSAAFPCLLKPMHFREWQAFPAGHPLSHQKVAIAKSPAELVAHWELASAVNSATILQEIIEGPDTAKRVYLAVYSRDGRRIARAMFRELRCDPVGFGPASVSEPVDDPETDAVCDVFLRRIGYVGICEIEMKWDSRDGQVRLIEANPRLSGGGDAAPYAGVELCWLHYLDLIDQPVSPVAPSGRAFRHVVLRSDVRTVFNYRRAGLLGWGEVLASYRGPLAFFDLDRRDWRYSLRTLLIMTRDLGRGILSGLRRAA